MAYTKYSLTPANNTAAPPDGAPEGMLPSAVNDTMRDMMSQIRDVGDGIRDGTYTMTAPKITGGSITGVTFSSSAATITGGSVTGVTFSSSAATITGGSVTGVTFSSSAATITGGSVTGITDLAIADGGTGASTAAGARTNLGLDGFVNMKNRIINGAMVIDQRNAGASVTPSTGTYSVDRWRGYQNVASKFTMQQNAGSVTPPAGFTNYLGMTSSSAYSASGTDLFLVGQFIEGFNVSDLGWGTANAKTITISFWVRSSLTGTFGGSLTNGAENRSYPFTYTISSANTWEQKSVTIAGDTSGTWITNNGMGLAVYFTMGVGSTYAGTAGAWAGAAYFGATGATSVVGTNGATFYITGVQLEVGTNATSFDFRPYGTELALCQRYYQKSYETGTAVGTSTFANAVNTFGTAAAATAGTIGAQGFFRVDMRASATVSIWDSSGNSGKVSANPYGGSVVTNNNGSVVSSGANQVVVERASGTSCNGIIYHYAASAEL